MDWCLLSFPWLHRGIGVIQGPPLTTVFGFFSISLLPWASYFLNGVSYPFWVYAFIWLEPPFGSFLKWVHGRQIFEHSMTKNVIILPLFLIDNLAGYNLLDWKSYPLDYFVEDIECFQNFKCFLELFLS